jgi:hypothetical protein
MTIVSKLYPEMVNVSFYLLDVASDIEMRLKQVKIF